MNVIITGTSRGIGFELVNLFSAIKEHKVIALSRNPGALKKFQDRANLQPLAFDVGNPDNLQELQDLVKDFFQGETEILINNAATLLKKPFTEFTSTDFDRLFRVNVNGVFFLIQQLYPFFKAPSHIVNIGSMGGFQGSTKFPGLSLYAATKGALAILSECLAQEFKPAGIAVNTLAIGAVDTQMQKEAFPEYNAQVKAADMAEYIMNFALNGSKVYNGKTIPVSLSTP